MGDTQRQFRLTVINEVKPGDSTITIRTKNVLKDNRIRVYLNRERDYYQIILAK